MNVAFYAPLKSPNHPVPSGDRTMARGVIKALETAGHHVTLASELRTHHSQADPAAQASVLERARAETRRIVGGHDPRPDIWITYHNYYKAPDLIGPTVQAQFGIPYIIIEASRARKRLGGPWALYAEHAERACDSAQAILYVTDRDAEALTAYAPPGQKLARLSPFLAQTELPQQRTGAGIVAVGMMRAGDKARSFQLIAATLREVSEPWHLTIVGSGPEEPAIKALFAPFGQHVSFAGALDGPALDQAYRNASILFWPGVNEAFGMTYLEAQARGLTVLAQDRPGVRDVVHAPLTPESTGADGLATRLRQLLTNLETCEAEGAHVRAAVATDHLLPNAARTLDRIMEQVT